MAVTPEHSKALDPKAVRPRTYSHDKRAALQGWLRTALGQPQLTITAETLLSGGAVQENWRLQVVPDSGQPGGKSGGKPETSAESWVMRTDANQRLSLSLDRAAEYQVIEAAFASGVPVAEPIVRCQDPTVIGRPFLIQRFVEGEAAARQIVRDPALADTGPHAAAALGAALAKVHRMRPADRTLSVLPVPMLEPARAEVTRLRAAITAASQPRPALEFVLAWLDAHAPVTPQLTLVHGDFRTGNYLLQAGTLAAVLDWEFAHWGDPYEDIGWFCARCWRFGQEGAAFEAGGIAPRAAFYDGYAAAGGTPIDPAAVAYWEILAAARWAAIALLQGDRYFKDGETSIELALTGAMVPEMEFDCLEGIAALALPTPAGALPTPAGKPGPAKPPTSPPAAPPSAKPTTGRTGKGPR
jgi:aminoglycoside phosphotransferase (APT) family kinase protein